MKPASIKQLWFYPLLFGILGALIGLVLRHAFTGAFTGFPIKNVLHSHSHVMLLGFVFNAFIVLLWTFFTKGIDRLSFLYYIALQICLSVMLVAFIIQGYALISITFSTLHLWISYILLIRLWKRLNGNKNLVSLIKVGILFHFISSIGPYCLGPLMVFKMQESPWYQQAIFFYLHFQYLGSFLVWLLAIVFQKTAVSLKRKQVLLITLCSVLLYTHSLNYSFNYWLINTLGGIGAILLFSILFSIKKQFQNQETIYKLIYYILLCIVVINIAGSLPLFASLVEENRFILIAYLHFLFLGCYLPFIWIFIPIKINIKTWICYGITVLFSEAVLIFPSVLSKLFSTSVMWLLFIVYLGVFLCICIVHLKYLLSKTNDITTTR